MNRTRFVLLVLALLSGSAHAHQDRILSVDQNGSIPEIPASFGRVSLGISGLGSDSPTVTFGSGDRLNRLPSCVTRLIRAEKLDDVLVTGSWYHRESTLPYYISVKFYEPSRNEARSYNSSLDILFNLRTAEVIQIKRFVASESNDGGRYEAVDLPEGCAPSWREA